MNGRTGRQPRGAIWIAVAALAAAGCIPSADSPPATSAPVTAPVEQRRDGVLVLGSPDLFAGIPGSGPLTIAEVRAWLARPENHESLNFCLPLGLETLTTEKLVPADNPLTRAKIELGRQLFFDRRLSRDKTLSCGDCHNPKQSFANYFFEEGRREPAAAFNRLFSAKQFWDGRATSLETQPLVPLNHKDELNLPPDELVARLKKIPGYREQFTTIFEEVSIAAICQALACFERAIVSGPAPWDYHATYERLADRPQEELSSDELALLAEADEGRRRAPLPAAAERGAALFFGDRTHCSHCHTGPNFTDEAFHNTGAGMDRPQPDQGRFLVTGRDEDRGAFKTPTLRNLGRSHPFLHDGRFFLLPDAVKFFCDGGLANEHLSPLMRPLDLSAEERADLVAFLQALNGPLPEPRQDRLPE